MGYDLHITRGLEWSDRDGPCIGMEEWLAVIDGDQLLDLSDGLSAISPNGEIVHVPSQPWSRNVARPSCDTGGALRFPGRQDQS